MYSRIELLLKKKLMGKHLTMSLADNKTYELWHSFMISKKDIKNNITTDLISMQRYDPSLTFSDFNQDTVFEKWAAIEVSDCSIVPAGMEGYILQGGLYAVFIHKGMASDFPKTFQFIFNDWLPNSEYVLDNREHFEILGDKYKNNDPNSEEEIWVPVKSRA
ncbi:MAG TPA: GyrI-like domain-containing protein [Ferruginibacter sp.]|jgi:AraC family transcriptional regulator|nr:GyrI-like domain-containing protein [Ferruginibacter sp.]